MAPELRIHFAAQGQLLQSALECEAEVFLRWFGNTSDQLKKEYGSYEDSSVFLVVADRLGEARGAVRLIAPGGRAGLKTLADVGQEPWGVDGERTASAVGIAAESTWDVATLGVRGGSAAERQRLSLALYHGLMSVAQVNQMSSFVAILDERVRRLLASVGIVTRRLPGTTTAPYLGSAASTPVYAHFQPLLENQRRHFPDAYRLVTLGVGLDGITVPALEAFRLPKGESLVDLMLAGGLSGDGSLVGLSR